MPEVSRVILYHEIWFKDARRHSRVSGTKLSWKDNVRMLAKVPKVPRTIKVKKKKKKIICFESYLKIIKL